MIDERLYIDELLKRFMDGETTLAEERELGDWLRSHEVDDSLKPYQRMFAAFDAGLPLEVSTTPRRHMAWWPWAAAAAIVVLLAIGLTRMTSRPTPTVEQPVIVTQAPSDTFVATPKAKVEVEKLADVRQTNLATKAKPRAKKETAAPAKVDKLSKKDSVEVSRTAGDLELAESEYLAEQQELERQLQELRQQRLARKSGWHYTTLPCE